MEIKEEISITEIRRVGSGRSRPILVKLENVQDKSIIFKNASKLKGKRNARKKLYFVQDDMADFQAESRQQYKDLRKENEEKDNEDRDTIKYSRGDIMINGQKKCAIVSAPTAATVLRLTQKELEYTKAFKLVRSATHSEKNSDYYSFVAKVSNIEQVNTAYNKVRIKHADATHISCAYRLQQPEGAVDQEMIDDGDFGISRAMMKAMKQKDVTELAVFIVRYYGNVHLGKRRFEIAEFLTNTAINTWNVKLVKKEQRRERINSQDSFISLASVLSLEEDELQEEVERAQQSEEVVPVQPNESQEDPIPDED